MQQQSTGESVRGGGSFFEKTSLALSSGRRKYRGTTGSRLKDGYITIYIASKNKDIDFSDALDEIYIYKEDMYRYMSKLMVSKDAGMKYSSRDSGNPMRVGGRQVVNRRTPGNG